MTEFIKKPVAATVLWWPVIFKGACWVGAEVCIIAAALLHDYLKEPEPIRPMLWWIFALTVIGKACMTVRLFMDQTVSRHAEKIASNDEEIPTVTLSPDSATK